MTYRIETLPRAERDLEEIYRIVGVRSSLAAKVWYRGLKDAIRTLRMSPKAWPSTPEDKNLRHLLYGNKPHIYRVVYRIVEVRKCVEVLHVRHGARDRFLSEDISPN
ncbi:MAG: type II toxin-antitoxin system RelE/ParE family toxin [Acidobacteria bacterium]|nr:type II toxin-antitoxin system RelE/ParE family toxin [Acidobacteriota bacterium]